MWKSPWYQPGAALATWDRSTGLARGGGPTGPEVARTVTVQSVPVGPMAARPSSAYQTPGLTGPGRYPRSAESAWTKIFLARLPDHPRKPSADRYPFSSHSPRSSTVWVRGFSGRTGGSGCHW